MLRNKFLIRKPVRQRVPSFDGAGRSATGILEFTASARSRQRIRGAVRTAARTRRCRAVPDLVDLVEQVDDVEAQRGRLVRCHDVEIVRQAEIDLGVRGQVIGVGKAGAKAAAIDHRRAETRGVPQIGRADRCSCERIYRLIVVRRRVERAAGSGRRRTSGEGIRRRSRGREIRRPAAATGPVAARPSPCPRGS